MLLPTPKSLCPVGSWSRSRVPWRAGGCDGIPAMSRHCPVGMGLGFPSLAAGKGGSEDTKSSKQSSALVTVGLGPVQGTGAGNLWGAGLGWLQPLILRDSAWQEAVGRSGSPPGPGCLWNSQIQWGRTQVAARNQPELPGRISPCAGNDRFVFERAWLQVCRTASKPSTIRAGLGWKSG